MRRRARTSVAVAVLVALALVAGCTSDDGDDATPTSGPATTTATSAAEGEVLVGEVDGGRGLIAVVHTADAVSIYACGFDEALGTHTGWFDAVPAADGDDRVIPPTSNAGGLAVEGRITGDDAEGTLTLASGDVVEWSAARATDGAGLYAAEDALALAGLIVATDDRMVGSATVRFDPTAIGGGPTTPSSPTTLPLPPAGPTTTSTTRPPSTTTTRPGATTTTTRPSTTPTAPGPVTVPIVVPPELPGGGPVTIGVPVTPEQTRPTPVKPITKPRTVTRTGPAIVFLVHGMSENASTPATDARPKADECEGPRNSPFYGRCEWGPDVIPGLFGGDVGASLTNLAGEDVTGDRFIDSVAGRGGGATFDETMGMAQASNGCAKDPAEEEELDPATAAHFITTPQAAPRTSAPVPVPPQLSVFTTWRDSTTGITEAGRRLARQAYAAARWWEETYQQTPQIIFMGQSFGGLATRFVLGNPTDASLRGVDPSGVALCPEDHARMDYLRNRTTYALTLATPHEGSFLAETGEGAKDVLRDALADLDAGIDGVEAGVDDTELGQIIRTVDEVTAQVAPGAPSVADLARDEIADLLALLESPALRDLRLDSMRRWNTGPLAPDRARRTGASPMAGAANQLIPLYATMARTPGSTSFDSPLLMESFETYETERPKEQGWIFMTSVLAEALVTQLSPVGWGSIDGALAPHAEILDRRARIFDLSTETAAAEEFVAQAAEGILGSPAAYFEGEFGAGVDGILAYLDSVDAQAFFPTALVPIYLDRVWIIDLSGSVEVPMVALTCGGEEVVLDYDPLVDALLRAHGATSDALDAIGSGDVAALLSAAGAALDDGGELAVGTMTWFQEKVDELGDAAGDDCALPTDPEDLLTDPLSVGNLANWEVTGTTGEVPAPAWVRTDEVARDGEQDTDGAVHAASALGLQLGRDPFFFEHDRGGSWYRIPDEPLTEQYNHGFQYQNDVGRWVRERFFATGVGPVPRADGDSAWPA